MPDNDFLVEFDKATSHITVANIKSRMSLDEAKALSGELARVAEENTPSASETL